VPTSETHRVSAKNAQIFQGFQSSSFAVTIQRTRAREIRHGGLEENWELIFSCPPWPRRSRAGKKKEAAEATHAIAASISSASSSSL